MNSLIVYGLYFFSLLCCVVLGLWSTMMYMYSSYMDVTYALTGSISLIMIGTILLLFIPIRKKLDEIKFIESQKTIKKET